MTRPLSGIYKITNQLNGKVYIGQSQNVYHREREH
jgi:predicted GIY-YIG superfamily endonuclease